MFRFNGFMVTMTIIFLAMCVNLSSGQNKYCSVCENHTMCRFKGLGPECKNVGGSGVSGKERHYIVDAHNVLRSRVALGQERRGKGGPQKRASNMMKLYWDKNLAEVAQRWADQCHFGHDDCRHDPRFKVGQNVYWKNQSPVHKVNWTEAVSFWYNEVDLFQPNSIESFIYDGTTAHYTQMVWHSTTWIGCGRRDYGDSKLYVCNYGPTGNVMDKPIYSAGETCSKCPENTVCDHGLCAANETIIDVTTTAGETMEYIHDIIDNEAKPQFIFQDDNDILLDSETLAEVENLKFQIINLIKKVVKKTKLQIN